jgi:hypothetical protein
MPLAQKPDDMQVTPLNAIRRGLVAALQLPGCEVWSKIDAIRHARYLAGALPADILQTIGNVLFPKGIPSKPSDGSRIIRFPRKRFNLLTLSINACGIDLTGFTASA